MPDADGTPPVHTTQVRLSLRSALALVLALGLTILVLEVALSSQRVIGWMLTAGAVAALVYPLVELLARYIPRGLSVLLVVLIGLAAIGFVGYRLVDDVAKETRHLQELAPKRAAQLEKDSELLREIDLQRRVQRLVDAIPERLAGGTPAEAIRSTATRGLAFLASVILTIFFILYGKRIIEGGLGQIRDPDRRHRVEDILTHGGRRGLEYARIKVLEVLIEGVIAYAVARGAGVPGPAALAVWVGLWTLLPVAGVLIGALPIVAFAGASSVSRAVLVALVFVVIGLAEFLIAPFVERETVRVGPFLTVLAAFAGLELYGLMGALLALLGVIMLAAFVAEIGPEEVAEVIVAPLAGVADDEPPPTT